MIHLIKKNQQKLNRKETIKMYWEALEKKAFLAFIYLLVRLERLALSNLQEGLLGSKHDWLGIGRKPRLRGPRPSPVWNPSRSLWSIRTLLRVRVIL